MSAYDRIARLYDPWSVSVVEDVEFYVAEAELSLAWLPVEQWEALLAETGFVVEGIYGWFDRAPYAGHEDSIWVCRAV